jgi:hypothetical protein
VEWTGVGGKARVRDRRIARAAGFVVADDFDLMRRVAPASGSVTVEALTSRLRPRSKRRWIAFGTKASRSEPEAGRRGWTDDPA